ncbi:MAG: M24 family metallopeptidase [Myxococcales bacterium]|nr:M24 family metallopeptidase [Myxococcales bacterium]
MGEGAVALFLGARPATRSADTHYPFRQDSDFHYLTGFDHPGAAAVLRAGAEPAYTLFVEPRDPAMETWNGYRPGVDGAIRDYGADAAHPADELLERIPELLSGASRAFHVLGRDAAVDARITATIDEMRLRSRTGVVPPSEIVDPRAIVHEMRLFKEPGEIDVMRRAAAITAEAHQAGARLMQPGNFEYEVEAAINHTFRRRGAAGPAYESIVGGGRNATVLHYVSNGDKLSDGELVVVDAGCELDGYASDVTRTYPVGGRYQGAAKAVYEIVLGAQEASLAVAAPGRTLDEVHEASVRVLVEGLCGLGILSGELDGLIESQAFSPYYMHRTSHWLGLDVHDVGSYAVDGRARPLEPGMVFTVEPGLYIGADAEVDERFRGIGVRIEDDVVIHDGGHENLTSQVPKRPADVEAWMSGD